MLPVAHTLNCLNTYIRHEGLSAEHLRYADIQNLIKQYTEHPAFEHEIVGYSFQRCPINMFRIGHGPIKIFAWSQMHGDEATATASLFDLMDILADPQQCLISDDWKQSITLYMLPMLNPDGAQVMTRENAQGIDINRDALSLQSPEGKILMRLARQLQADFAFNLHDQSPYYQCGTSGNPATIAFLAPAFDQVKTINAKRARAMQLIASMRQNLEQIIPQHIARYDDTYSKRSFGDQIAGIGSSTILVESGAHRNDPKRQVARALNTKILLDSLHCIMDPTYPINNHDMQVDAYFAIPENQSDRLCSLLITNLAFAESSYHADISIVQTSRYSQRYVVDAVGDLSVLAGLAKYDARGLHFQHGRAYPLTAPLFLDDERFVSILREGYSHFVGDATLLELSCSMLPLINPAPKQNGNNIVLKMPAYGLLYDAEKPSKALINGTIIELLQGNY